jgi:hypothetical protein
MYIPATSVQPPADIFVVYIDGVDAAQLADNGEFSDVALAVSPGAHTIDLSYQYNPFSISDLPESPPTRLGATWVDNVSIESMAEAPDSRASASSAYTTTFPDMISLSTLVRVICHLLPFQINTNITCCVYPSQLARQLITPALLLLKNPCEL